MTLKNDKLLALIDQHTAAYIKNVETSDDPTTAAALGTLENKVTEHIEKFGAIAPSKAQKPKVEG